MRLPKKIATLLTISLVTTSGGTYISHAQEVKGEKLIGKNRWETAIEISKNGWTSGKEAIIVNDEAIADALAATPFADAKNAPILLNGKDNLDDRTKAELKRLRVSKVYLIGGETVLSENLEKQLKEQNIQVERIKGETREHTALAIAKKLDEIKDISKIAVVNGTNGLADAVSIAAVAAENDMAIILSNPKDGTKVADEFIKNEDIQTSYVIGGEAVISSSVEVKLVNAKRINGNDRNETNANVIETFYTNRNLNNVYVAKDGKQNTGDLIDALAVGVLAAKNDSPVMIVGSKLSKGQVKIGTNKKFTKVTQTGGNGNEAAYEELLRLQFSGDTSGSIGGGGSNSGGGGGGTTNPTTPQDQVAPSGLVGLKATNKDNKDGKITGLDSKKLYEYKLATPKEVSAYKSVLPGSTEITNLGPGTYYIRLAAISGKYNASPDTSVTIDTYIENPNPDPSKTPLQKLEEQIRDMLKNICQSIDKSNVDKSKIQGIVSSIENILNNCITQDEILPLISNLKQLSVELSKVNINDAYYKNQFGKDLKQIFMTLQEVLSTCQKLQSIKAQLNTELANLNQQLNNIAQSKKSKIEQLIKDLEALKQTSPKEVQDSIARVEAELNKILQNIVAGNINKEQVQSAMLYIDGEQSQIDGKSQEATTLLNETKAQLIEIVDAYGVIENIRTQLNNVINNIDSLDTTSVKNFVESSLVEINKLPDSSVKNELTNLLNQIKNTIKTFELVQETIQNISQTDNPLEVINIISNSGLISKGTIEEAKRLVAGLEEQVNALPEGDLKPVAQLGVTSIKLVIELVEKNGVQGSKPITTVDQLIKFLLNTDSVTVDTLRQAKSVLELVEKIVNQLPDGNPQLAQLKSEINSQIKTFKGILDAAISVGQLDEFKEKVEKALADLNTQLSKLESAGENVTQGDIDKAKSALEKFKQSLNTGNDVFDGALNLTYYPKVKDAEKKISNAQVILNGTGIVRGTVTDKSKLPVKDVTITATDSKGNTVTATSNDIGIFTMSLPGGTYTLNYSKAGYEAEPQTVIVEKGKNLTISAEIGKINATVSGYVRNKYYIPVVDVDIVAKNSDGIEIARAKSETLGVYKLELAPGSYTLELSKAGHKTSSTSVVLSKNEYKILDLVINK
ncbi:cell wall-binding repeat-containing protein [Romboutsia sp.]|uniref:cell wall-binding repeat-containing protein n=1 Tax=Romboutsia sp. TaxID=1965302 RepID=UPI003F34076E